MLNSLKNKRDLYYKKQLHVKFITNRLWELHTEITDNSMQLHTLTGKKLEIKVNRLVLLSSNIDRYKRYLKLITFMQR